MSHKPGPWLRAYIRYMSFWARLVVRRRRPFVIGITGSVGKTTTKEAVAAVLAHPDARAVVGDTWATPGNMNNDRCVPLVLLGYRQVETTSRLMLRRALTVPVRALRLALVGPYPRNLVLEFAAGPRADISRTAALARPDVAIVTAVGPAHLEHFRTVERVAEAKGALVRLLEPTGLAVLGADNEPAAALARLTTARVVTVRGRGRALSEGIAREVASVLGIPSDVVDRALADRGAVKSRLEVLALGSRTVINDAYNANPISMAYGLDTLAESAKPGQRRVAVLGDMGELGDESARYHREMGAHARSRADLVIGVGPLSVGYIPDHWYPTSQACAAAIDALVAEGDIVLVKGSNSVRLGHVVNALRRAADAPGSQAAPAG